MSHTPTIAAPKLVPEVPNLKPYPPLEVEGEVALDGRAAKLLEEITPKIQYIRHKLIESGEFPEEFANQKIRYREGLGFVFDIVLPKGVTKESLPASAISRLIGHADFMNVVGDSVMLNDKSFVVGRTDPISSDIERTIKGKTLKDVAYLFTEAGLALDLFLECEEGWESVDVPNGSYLNARVRGENSADAPKPVARVLAASLVTIDPIA